MTIATSDTSPPQVDVNLKIEGMSCASCVGRIEKALSDSLGRPVQLGHLSFSLFSGSLVADNVAIADDPAFGSTPFLRSVHAYERPQMNAVYRTYLDLSELLPPFVYAIILSFTGLGGVGRIRFSPGETHPPIGRSAEAT